MIKKRVQWIDFAKCLAIFSVILEHLYRIVFANHYLWAHLVYSVELFVIVGGYTASISLSHNGYSFKYLMRRLGTLLIPYSIASFIYYLYFHNLHFNAIQYIKQLVAFSTTGIFYFIFFYCQLIIISGILFFILRKKKLWLQFVLLCFIYGISVLCNNIHIMNLYGAGGCLFGGTYLFTYACGIFLYDNLEKINRKNLILLIISTSIVFFIYESSKMYLQAMKSPPSIFQILYALIIFIFIYGAFGRMRLYRFQFFKPLLYIGKNSYYFYLYHYLGLLIAIKVTNQYSILRHIYKPFFLFFAFLVPIVVLVILQSIKRLFFFASRQYD